MEQANPWIIAENLYITIIIIIIIIKYFNLNYKLLATIVIITLLKKVLFCTFPITKQYNSKGTWLIWNPCCTHLSTFPLLVTELHHSVKPMTMKMVHTKQLIHAMADRMQVVNLKYTTLDWGRRTCEHCVVPKKMLYILPKH